jgi:hypothetical protein
MNQISIPKDEFIKIYNANTIAFTAKHFKVSQNLIMDFAKNLKLPKKIKGRPKKYILID